MFFPAADTIAFSEGGVESMRLNSSGVLVTTNDASISGLTVGKGGSAVASNTVVGASALNANTTGSELVAIGTGALLVNTTGTTNTAVGRSALVANTTGGNNTGVGGYSLFANTTGTLNTAVGSGALFSNTTSSQNTAIGYQALVSNTGSNNTSVGMQAMYANTSGGNNSALGTVALYANTTGSNNVAIGQESLRFNTTASNNTAVGYQAGYSSTTGGNAIAIGYQALYSNTTASNNVAIGYQAGYSSTGGGNTLVGYSAGNALTTGTGNAFYGLNPAVGGAGHLVTTGSKNTIIGGYSGNQGGLDIRTASNYIVLSDGDGNPRQIINGSGSVGVGTVPSAWAGGFTAIQIGNGTDGGASIAGDNASYAYMTSNAYYNGSAWVYYTGASNKASNIYMGPDGIIQTRTTNTAGTAGNTISWTFGPYVAAGGTSWTNASDAKLKNITGEISDALNKVSQIRAAKFTWKADASAKPCVGLIAQDVQSVLPEAVVVPEKETDVDGNPTFLGVNYDQVIPLLVASIKELNEKLEAQALEIAQLKGN
jgi:hypothetical protein